MLIFYFTCIAVLSAHMSVWGVRALDWSYMQVYDAMYVLGIGGPQEECTLLSTAEASPRPVSKLPLLWVQTHSFTNAKQELPQWPPFVRSVIILRKRTLIYLLFPFIDLADCGYLADFELLYVFYLYLSKNLNDGFSFIFSPFLKHLWGPPNLK